MKVRKKRENDFCCLRERKEETIYYFQKPENRCSTEEIVSKFSSKCFPTKLNRKSEDFLNITSLI